MAVKIHNLTHQLPCHSTKRYKIRTSDQINRIVLHKKTYHMPLRTSEDIITRMAFYDVLTGTPGYPHHFTIDADGCIFKTALLEHVTWHAGIWNRGSVSVAVLGTESSGMPSRQRLSLVRLCAALGIEFNLLPDRIIAHCNLMGATWLPFGKHTCASPGICAQDINTCLIRENVLKHMQHTLSILGLFSYIPYNTTAENMTIALLKYKLHQRGKR